MKSISIRTIVTPLPDNDLNISAAYDAKLVKPVNIVPINPYSSTSTHWYTVNWSENIFVSVSRVILAGLTESTWNFIVELLKICFTAEKDIPLDIKVKMFSLMKFALSLQLLSDVSTDISSSENVILPSGFPILLV